MFRPSVQGKIFFPPVLPTALFEGKNKLTLYLDQFITVSSQCSKKWDRLGNAETIHCLRIRGENSRHQPAEGSCYCKDTVRQQARGLSGFLEGEKVEQSVLLIPLETSRGAQRQRSLLMAVRSLPDTFPLLQTASAQFLLPATLSI